MKQFIYLLFLTISSLRHTLDAKIILDFEKDFNAREMPTGLNFYWNPKGVELGNEKKYSQLNLVPARSTLVVDANDLPGPDCQTENAHWLRAYRLLPFPNQALKTDVEYDVIRISPGDAAKKSTDGLDHYAILAYTIQPGEAGNIRIQNSQLYRVFDDESGMISLYVNDRHIGSDELPGKAPMSLDLSLGHLDADDTIYIAFGPGADRAIGYVAKLQLTSD